MSDVFEEPPNSDKSGRPYKSEAGSYKCRFCGLTYAYMSTLRAHERVHDVSCPYICNTCGDSFMYNSELQAHSLGHTGKKSHKCFCGRGFLTYAEFLNHRCEYDGEDRQPFDVGPDNKLPESSADKTSIPLYGNRSYPLGRFYMCQFCSKAYPNSRELKNHILTHRGESGFQHVTQGSKYMSTYTGSAVYDRQRRDKDELLLLGDF